MQLKDQQSAKESYFQLMSQDSKTFLIDVRSPQEWISKGIPDLSEKSEELVLCEWRVQASVEDYENFFDKLNEKINFEKIDCLYFICAAGIRSQEAATYTERRLKKLGVSIKCVNVFDGFTGNSSNFFNFRKGDGWKSSGLPCCSWKKSDKDNSDRGLRC